MDGRRFDTWTQSLIAFGSSRRAIVRTLAGGMVGGLFAAIGGDEASAKCVRAGKKCREKSGKKRKCCAGAKCQGKKCKCTGGRQRCGPRCCPIGHICAGGQCVIGQAECPPGADSCAGELVTCGGIPTCACAQRLEGGTRCGQATEATDCGQCASDADCLEAGFPAGSSCVSGQGSACGCPPSAPGICAAPCGLGSPTQP